MTAAKIAKCEAPTSQQASDFIADYAAWMLGCGATCIRLQKNIARIAEAWNMRVEITILPRHLHLSFFDGDSHLCSTSVVSAHKSPINFDINTRLSQLSWKIADGQIHYECAKRAMHQIVAPGHSRRWLTLVLVGLANAAFCRLFNGDGIAMLTVGIATLVGFDLRNALLDRGIDSRVVWFLSAFVASVLGATDSLFHLGNTPDIALATSVLFLVPGIPLLNSFSDLIYRHYICAFSRFLDAMVLICCLSAGLCTSMILMNIQMFP